MKMGTSLADNMHLAHYPIIAITVLMIVMAIIITKLPMDKLELLMRGVRDVVIHFTQLQHFKNMIYLIFVVTAIRCIEAVLNNKLHNQADSLGIIKNFLYLFGLITGVYFTGKDSTRVNGDHTKNKARRDDD